MYDPAGMSVLDADESLVCTLEVKNTGNVRLTTTTVQGQPNCAGLPTLLPGSSAQCNVSKVASQADFDSWDLALGSSDPAVTAAGKLQLSVPVSAKPAAGLQTQSVTATVAVPLVSRPSFKVPVASLVGGNTSQLVKAGKLTTHLSG